MPTVAICGTTFTSQRQIVKAITRLRLDRAALESEAGQALAMELARRYSKVHDAMRELGGDVDRVYAGMNPKYAHFGNEDLRNQCLVVVVGDTHITVSQGEVAKDALNPGRIGEYRLLRRRQRKKDEMREMVWTDAADFKAERRRRGGMRCDKCDADLEDRPSFFVHADHDGAEFRHIVKAFARGRELATLSTEGFREEHDRLAKLQLLCMHCNVRKPRKEADAAAAAAGIPGC